MPKIALLEICQNIASDMDSFGFNSITEDDEGMQIARVVKEQFELMQSTLTMVDTEKRYQLQTLAGFPNMLKMPDNAESLTRLQYRQDDPADASTRMVYADLIRLEPEVFSDMMLGLNELSTNVTAGLDPDGAPVKYSTNSPPAYFTSFDNENIMFDSYQSGFVGNADGVTAGNTICFGEVVPVFLLEDTYVPEIPENAFMRLITTSKAACFDKLNGEPNRTAEMNATRAKNDFAATQHRTGGAYITRNNTGKR